MAGLQWRGKQPREAQARFQVTQHLGASPAHTLEALPGLGTAAATLCSSTRSAANAIVGPEVGEIKARGGDCSPQGHIRTVPFLTPGRSAMTAGLVSSFITSHVRPLCFGSRIRPSSALIPSQRCLWGH